MEITLHRLFVPRRSQQNGLPPKRMIMPSLLTILDPAGSQWNIRLCQTVSPRYPTELLRL
jgi:hypothetical protein